MKTKYEIWVAREISTGVRATQKEWESAEVEKGGSGPARLPIVLYENKVDSEER